MAGQKGALSGTITRIVSNGSWNSSQGGTFFSFKVDLDGDEPLKDAEYNQKNEVAKYKVGDKISFDKQVDDKGRVKLKNHAIDSGNAGPSGKGSSYNDPIEIKKTALSMSQQMAIAMYYKMNEKKGKLQELLTAESTQEEIKAAQLVFPKALKYIDALAIYFFNYVINCDPLTRDNVIRRAYAIERGIAMIGFQGMTIDEEGKSVGVNSSADVLVAAQHLIDQQMLIV